MKVLCLHGAATNAEVLKDQLTPLIYELRKSQPIEFHFLNGSTEISRYPGLSTHYNGPFYRYYGHAAPDITQLATLLPGVTVSLTSLEGETVAREVRRLCPGDYEVGTATKVVLDFANNSHLGPFDGLLGFSEGASVAANVLIEQARSTSIRSFKCAIFISGLPPPHPDNRDFYLADHFGQLIDLPTAHIIGEKDPGRCVNLALLNLCTSRTASRLDHKQGHEIPRVPATTKKMAKLISEMVAMAEKDVESRIRAAS